MNLVGVDPRSYLVFSSYIFVTSYLPSSLNTELNVGMYFMYYFNDNVIMSGGWVSFRNDNQVITFG